MPTMYLPPEEDRERLLAPIQVPDAQWCDPAWRRYITRRHPFYFALIYGERLLDPYETGDLSISRLHLEIALSAGPAAPGAPPRWSLRAQQRVRDYWVAPRGSGKTTWLFQLLPLWAMCHGYVHSMLALGDNATLARQHMAEIRILTESEPAILTDYPHMRPGRRDSADQVVFRGGQSMMAQGWEAKVLGTKEQGKRPDLIVIDDLEPGNEAYTEGAREKRLRALKNTILPINQDAIVQINQSVPHHGSITHGVVRAVHGLNGEQPEPWITAGGWNCHHRPAIEIGPDGRERSLWDRQGANPGGWTLDWLRHEREVSPGSYALNYDGRALPPGTAASWRRDLFIPAPPHWRALQRVLAVDGAVSNKATSDETGFAVAAQATGAHPLETVIEYARGFRLAPDERRGQVIELLAQSPDIKVVVADANQGGDLWLYLLRDLHTDPRWPKGRPPVRIELLPAGKLSKPARLAAFLYRWEQGKVRPGGPLPAFEAQAERYPHVDHDDVLDAAEIADRRLSLRSAVLH
jgi:hypothetical protein